MAVRSERVTVGAAVRLISNPQSRRPRTQRRSVTTAQDCNAISYVKARRDDPNFHTYESRPQWEVRGLIPPEGPKSSCTNVVRRHWRYNRLNSDAWCTSTATASCVTARNNYGKASARGAFEAPCNFRITTLLRF